MARYEILGMPVDRLPVDEFIDTFVENAKRHEGGYVCVPNVHQCILCYDEPAHMEIVKGARWVMPDSTVLHKFVALKNRLPKLTTLRGDQMTSAICHKAAAEGVAVALVGGKDEAILARMERALHEQCAGLRIVYTYSPPFRDLSAEEEEAMLAALRNSGAGIIFVGLGCPKQERWMARYTDRLPGIMMIGVGAAFDFLSGEVDTSPSWMHGAGLEWLHRLVSEPRRLGRRYLTTSPRFVWLYLTRDRAGRLKA